MNARRQRSCNDHRHDGDPFMKLALIFLESQLGGWLCVVPVKAVISPRNKKNVCKPGLILFLLACFWGPLYCVCWLYGCFEVLPFWHISRCVLPRSRIYSFSYSFSCVAVSQSVSQQCLLGLSKSGARPRKLSIKLIIISAFNAKLLHAKCN